MSEPSKLDDNNNDVAAVKSPASTSRKRKRNKVKKPKYTQLAPPRFLVDPTQLTEKIGISVSSKKVKSIYGGFY